IHQLALADIARKRRESAEEELDAALDLAELPVMRRAPKPVSRSSQVNFYEYGDSVYRRRAELEERSSSVWAMPL
ncbi:MAG: MFS transporter, partial [Rhodococcus sp. (in: high G+C Gram-positive bacteria)]